MNADKPNNLYTVSEELNKLLAELHEIDVRINCYFEAQKAMSKMVIIIWVFGWIILSSIPFYNNLQYLGFIYIAIGLIFPIIAWCVCHVVIWACDNDYI